MQSSSTRSRGFALGISLALAWVLVSAWVHRGHFVDDAYISLRYAANLLSGEGLVFNPGEVVEGVTNLGWVLVVAGVGWVAPGALPLVAKGLGLAFLVGAVTLVALAYRRLAPAAQPLEVALVPVLAVSVPELVYFSVAGMETGLAALLVVLAAWLVARDPPHLMGAAVCCAGLFVVRPEGVLVFPLFALTRVLARPSRRGSSSPCRPDGWRDLGGGSDEPPAEALRQAQGDRRPEPLSRRWVVAPLLVFLGLVVAATLARWAYFGALLPNTFVAKGAGGGSELLHRGWDTLVGRNPNLPAPFVASLLLVLGGLGAASLWRRHRAAAAFLGSAVATGLLFALYAPPDWTGMGRYFAPYVPAAAVLGVRGAYFGLARVPRLSTGSARGTATLLVALFVALGLWRGQRHLGTAALAEYPGFVLSSESLVPAARWIDRELPVGTVIAARRIGALAYFGRRPVFDYAFGLTDPDVARAAAAAGDGFELPDDPRLAGLWRAARPGCLLEDEAPTARLAPRPALPVAGARPPALAVHGLRYEVVRSFPLGDGGTRWVLACRPGVTSPRAR